MVTASSSPKLQPLQRSIPVYLTDAVTFRRSLVTTSQDVNRRVVVLLSNHLITVLNNGALHACLYTIFATKVRRQLTQVMLLGDISLLDCGVFVVCLIPNLLVQAGPVQTVSLAKILPFVLFQLPYQLVHERYFLNREEQSPFEQHASFFQDLVIRIVRYAFARVPASIGRVFFSKSVALPFFRFRLLRNGYLRSPMQVKQINTPDMRGLWIVHERSKDPDVVVYYCHGGGFSMGSSYFYLEFLMAWITRLRGKGFQNPAIFALEYTLVPDSTWPVQYEETRAGYEYLWKLTGDCSKICLSGDSAGATLMLSLLLSMDQDKQLPHCGKPGLAVLVSPWTHLISDYNQNTASDYLDRTSLHLYARQYVGDTKSTLHARTYGKRVSSDNPIISPGLNTQWKSASPLGGYCVIYGAEEVFAPNIAQTIRNMEDDGAEVKVYSEAAGIHAWPVVNLFLGRSSSERVKGLDIMTDFIAASMKPA